MTPYQAQEEDIPHILMIRERVDIRGRVRAMEPAEDMAALRVKPSSVGIIKQAPVLRWYTGQKAMDEKYARHAHKVVRRRRKIEERVQHMLNEARDNGLIHVGDPPYKGEGGIEEGDDHARGGSEGSGQAIASGSGSTDVLRPTRKTVVRVASADAHMSSLSLDTVSGSVKIDEFRRWGPLDLAHDRPPPSALAGRRDTVC